jgi:Rieske Fe-S protein
VAGVEITADGIVRTWVLGTLAGTEVAGIMTTVYPVIVITLVTVDGTSTEGIKTGEVGTETDVGMVIVFKMVEATGEPVGIETTWVEATVVGTSGDGMITKVVDLIVITTLEGTDVGTTEL